MDCVPLRHGAGVAEAAGPTALVLTQRDDKQAAQGRAALNAIDGPGDTGADGKGPKAGSRPGPPRPD